MSLKPQSQHWLFILAIAVSGNLPAQQIGVGVPFTGFSDSYHERMGINFGFSFPGGQGPGSRVVGLLPNGQLTSYGNIVFSQGGFGSAIPAFGGFDPNASGHFGFSGVNPGGAGFSLGLEMGKGSNRTFTNTTPSLTVQNGFGGSFASGQLSPFVTGLIPFTGDRGALLPPDNATTRAMSGGHLNLSNLGRDIARDLPVSAAGSPPETTSSAVIAAPSVENIKAQKARQREAEQQAIAAHIQAVEVHMNAGRVDLARLEMNRAIVLEKDATRKQALKSRLRTMK